MSPAAVMQGVHEQDPEIEFALAAAAEAHAREVERYEALFSR